MVNDYLEIQAGLPNGKQSSWEVCSVHSPSGWIGLAFRTAGVPVSGSFGVDTGCLGTGEGTGGQQQKAKPHKGA